MPEQPDFDSMSAEEMQRWMESLAKRQGATEGLTTNADMEVEEVRDDDERLAGQGEYIPHGWSKERWEAHLAKEEEDKARKLAEQQAAPEPEPEPETIATPEPAAEAAPEAAAGGMEDVDFENMSPEEAMRFMESLAKRQGATEGFTTDADMEVDEVSEDDERLAGQGEYIPHGWSQERWEEHLAKEQAAKDGKLTEEEIAEAAAEIEEAELTPDDLDDADEGELVAADLDDIFGGDNEIGVLDDLDEEPAGGEPVAADLDDIFGGDNEIGALDDLDDEDEAVAEPAAEQNPMDWLTGLADGDDDEDEIDLDALGELESAGTAESENPMDWLAGLAGEDEESAEALDFDMDMFSDMDTSLDDDEAEEGSMAWMESLAKRQGADSEELMTDADFDLPEPEMEDADEGPGYEPYSFESGTGSGMDIDEDDEMALPPAAELNTGQLELDDPESWLDSLATGVSASDEADDVVEEADEEDEVITQQIASRLNSGEDVSPEDMNAFFEAQFRKAEKRDVPDYLDEDELEDFEGFAIGDDADEGELVEAEIPDWLRESMGAEPPVAEADDDFAFDLSEEQPAKTDTAEMMIADLGLDDDVADDEFPDWLQGEMEADDTGDISDIFADTEADDADEAIAEMPDDAELPVDTDDSWVAAFSSEESGDLAEWYERASAELEGDEAPAPAETESAPAADAGELQPADLPLEENLPHGQPQGMPDWMSDIESVTAEPAAPEPVSEMAAPADDDLDWLSDDDLAAEADIPDWLNEQVDDSVAADDMPDWLADDEMDMDADDVPDWLRETMEDEQAAIPAPAQSQPQRQLPEPDEPALPVPEPAQQPAASIEPARRSPAPVMTSAADIDVDATLDAARSNAKSDLNAALGAYEQLIRANVVLDEVERDITKLTNRHQKNADVYQLLGDVQMRQGKLQIALDTYRKALNLL